MSEKRIPELSPFTPLPGLHKRFGIVPPSVELQALRDELAQYDDSTTANLRRLAILLEDGLIDEALHATYQAKLMGGP